MHSGKSKLIPVQSSAILMLVLKGAVIDEVDTVNKEIEDNEEEEATRPTSRKDLSWIDKAVRGRNRY